MNMEFKEKYLKYKKKYFGLKNILVGGQKNSPGQYVKKEMQDYDIYYYWGKNSVYIVNPGGSLISIFYPTYQYEYHKHDLLKFAHLDDMKTYTILFRFVMK